MISVLFVCLGNICRSPMAEALFHRLIKEEKLGDRIRVDSAGTGDWHIGHPPHEGTRTILDRHGIDYSGMKARQVTGEDFTGFDYIVCMDSKNLRDVNAFAESANHACIMKFMDLLPEEQNADVPDPYYTGNFEEVYRIVEAGSRRLLDLIRERENLT